jgi:hypothetical protein
MNAKTEVMSWKEQLAADAAKTAKQERPASSYISLKGGAMTYQDAPIPGNQLECIVVAHAHERTYYERDYDPDDNGPPDCFAQALEGGDLAPHPDVPAPMSDTCKSCALAQFGTAKRGKGPACKTYRKLAVIPSSALKADSGVADAEMALVRVPPTSVKNWSTYANKVASTVGLPPWAVKTMVLVKPHPKKQFEVLFEPTGPVDGDELLSEIHARIGSAESVLLTPYGYDKEDGKPEDAGPKKKSKF